MDKLAVMKIPGCNSVRKYHITTESILQNLQFLRQYSIEAICRTLHTKQVAAMQANLNVKT